MKSQQTNQSQIIINVKNVYQKDTYKFNRSNIDKISDSFLSYNNHTSCNKFSSASSFGTSLNPSSSEIFESLTTGPPFEHTPY